MITVRVASDFSRHPAGRHVTDGPYSGEAFRIKFIEPHLRAGKELLIDLDGARGYGSSFLEEAFGGLVRQGFAASELQKKITLASKNASLKYEIADYISKAGVGSVAP